jgi:hypothetical protein
MLFHRRVRVSKIFHILWMVPHYNFRKWVEQNLFIFYQTDLRRMSKALPSTSPTAIVFRCPRLPNSSRDFEGLDSTFGSESSLIGPIHSFELSFDPLLCTKAVVAIGPLNMALKTGMRKKSGYSNRSIVKDYH